MAAADLALFCPGPGEPADGFARVDRACSALGRPCLHIASEGGAIAVGPLFIPGRTSCFRCSRRFLACFDDGERGTRLAAGEPAPWMSALAAAVAVDELAAFFDRGANLRVASVSAITLYDRAQRYHNIVERSYTPALTPCPVCGPPARAAQAARPDAAFIVGSQRSGTTVLGLALGAHERVELVDEDRAYVALAGEPVDATGMTIYKVPNWTAAVGTFAAHFPGGGFLFLRRPAVQVAASMLTLRGFAGTSWAEHFAGIETRVAIAGFSDERARAALERHLRRAESDTVLMAALCAIAKQALVSEYRRRGLRVLEVDYERLVIEPEATLAAVLDFLGIAHGERALRAGPGPRGATIGQTERGRPIDAGSLDKYRRVLGTGALARIAELETSIRGELAGG